MLMKIHLVKLFDPHLGTCYFNFCTHLAHRFVLFFVRALNYSIVSLSFFSVVQNDISTASAFCRYSSTFYALSLRLL